MNLQDLKMPLPSIHWRAQSVSKKNPDAPKAMALAYMDARDVQDRLDEVCGPENWSDSYVETPKGRIICTISINCGVAWVSKSDGAGDTAVEGEKGGISDAFKRAAVKWGVGRYLYDMPTPWVECKLWNDKWSGWTPSGLAKLRALEPKPITSSDQQMLTSIRNAQVLDDLTKWSELHGEAAGLSDNAGLIRAAYKERLNQINEPQEREAA